MVFTNRIVIDNPFLKPVISYGLIAHNKSSDKWLIIRRKNSPEFISILKGYYRLSYIDKLLDNLYDQEIKIINNIISGEDTFENVFDSVMLNNYLEPGGREYAIERWYDLNLTILLNYHGFNNEYLFPRGRVNGKKEGCITCARREFIEETGIEINYDSINTKLYVAESHTGTNGKKYYAKYWYCELEEEIQPPKILSTEVSDVKWVTLEESEKYLSSYRYGMLLEIIESLKLENV